MKKRDKVLGFTGTRTGLSQEQEIYLRKIIPLFSYLAHGDCVGADEHAHDISRFNAKDIYIYPCYFDHLRAFCEGGNLMCDPMHPLERNRLIVDSCHVLLACPKGPEERRSGTWSTVRYARKNKRVVIIVYPNGAVDGPPKWRRL